MEDTKKIYKEYKNHTEALNDICPAPEKRKAYAIQGTLFGALSGMVVGLIVFWIPALILRFSHAGVAGIVGTAVSSFFGAVLGWGESFAQAKRKTKEPVLGAEVEPENPRQRRLARSIMTIPDQAALR